MLSIVYAAGCVMLPCLIYHIIALRRFPLAEHKWRHLAWCYVFLLYVFLIFHVTELGTVWNFIEHDLTFTLKLINIVPFQNQYTISYILNIILFVPLGFFLPLIWWEMRELKITVTTGFCFSLVIELSQMCNNRYSDIDDLLMNTVGTVLGYLLWMFTWKVFSHSNERAVSIEKKEPEILLSAALLGYFFLYNAKLIA